MSSIESKGQIPAEELKRIDHEAGKNYPHWNVDYADGRAFHGYIHGARTEYLRAHSSQPSGQLRWVKASERLPGKGIQVFAFETEAPIRRGTLEWSRDDRFVGLWFKTRSGTEEIKERSHRLLDLFWLEELPLQPIKEPVVDGKKSIVPMASEIGGYDDSQEQMDDPALRATMHWIAKYQVRPPDHLDSWEAGFQLAAQKVLNIYCKAMEQSRQFDEKIASLQSELSALREEKETGDEFNGSLIDQLKCELKSAHEEKEEYRKALREIYNGQSSKHHTYEDRLGPKDMAIIAMRVLDKYPSSCAPIPPDPDKALILSVLKWAHDIHINRAGQYWGKDYSNIAYGDDGIVREYLQSLTHKQE